MNQTAMITGASRGLGKTLATFLANQGHDLILTARGEEELNAGAVELAGLGGHIAAIPGDVNDPTHRTKLVATAQELGGLNLLINNASILGPSPQPFLADYPRETLEQVFAVNVLAPLNLIQEALPLLLASAGMVINISSDAAVGGYAGWGGYGASKAALDLLTKTLAAESQDDGVVFVSVDPGDMRTQMHQEAFPGEDVSDRPLPDATLPFWAWLFGQEQRQISGATLCGAGRELAGWRYGGSVMM